MRKRFTLSFLFAIICIVALITIPAFAQTGLNLTEPLRLDGGAAPSAFNPSDIAGLHSWYDFSDTTTLWTDSGCSTTPVALNGDLIGCVVNKVAGGVNLTQATTANKLTWTLPGWSALGIGTADGTNDFMQTAAFASALTQPTTIFVVVRMTGDFSVNRTFYDGITAANRHLLYHTATTGALRIFAGVSLNSIDSTAGTPLILTAVFNGATSELFKNGGSIKSGDAGTNTLTGLTIGARYIGDWNTQANFGEILVYNPSPSATNQALIESYLNTKWTVY